MSFFVSNSLKDKFSFEDILESSDLNNNKTIYKAVETENYPMHLSYIDNESKVDLEILSIDVQKKHFILNLDKDDYQLFINNVKKENKANVIIFNNHFKSFNISLKNIKNYEYVSSNLIKVCIVIS